MLESLFAAVRPVDPRAVAACRDHWNQLTKPMGSLGRLEELAATLAGIAGAPAARPGPAVVLVFAGDHGVAAESVSAYPQAVTVQMLLNMRAGGAAINVLSRWAGAQLVVTDVGSLAGPAGEEADLPPLAPGGEPVRVRRVRAGTANMARGAAMTRAEAAAAVLAGARVLADALPAAGPGQLPLVAVGELGIGNTTAAAALGAALTGQPPADLVGPGTGLDPEGLHRKLAVVEQALAANRPDPADPLGCLAAVGGLEFGAMAGAMLAAAARRAAVVVDGVSSAVAALLAVRLCPAAGGYLVAATRSPEPGQRGVLEALGLTPLLDLGLRLGETSGAALALPIIERTLALGAEMATFSSAGVSNRDDA